MEGEGGEFAGYGFGGGGQEAEEGCGGFAGLREVRMGFLGGGEGVVGEGEEGGCEEGEVEEGCVTVGLLVGGLGCVWGRERASEFDLHVR